MHLKLSRKRQLLFCLNIDNKSEHATLPVPKYSALQAASGGYRITAGITTCFTGEKEQLSCRPYRDGCWGWVRLPEDYPLGYGDETQAILEAFAERIRCPEAHRSSQPNGNLEEASPIPGLHNPPPGSVDPIQPPDFTRSLQSENIKNTINAIFSLTRIPSYATILFV